MQFEVINSAPQAVMVKAEVINSGQHRQLEVINSDQQAVMVKPVLDHQFMTADSHGQGSLRSSNLYSSFSHCRGSSMSSSQVSRQSDRKDSSI
jgi:hypothetical protein